MTKSTITRERLEWLSQISCRDDIEDIGGDEIRELASMALSAMDSEPVAVVEPSDYVTAAQLVGEGPARKAVHELYEGALRIGDKLYRHAQPATVVMDDEKLRALFDAWFASDCSFDLSPEASEADNIAWRESYWYAWQRCRTAMLQAQSSDDGEPTDDERIMAIEGINNCERCGDEGWIIGEMGITRCACSQDGTLTSEDTKQFEPVTTANKLPDDFDFDRFNDVTWLECVASNPHMHSPTTSAIARVALELNKRIGAGNSPVIPDGWVACSERMPEGMTDVHISNGHDVGQGWWDGDTWQTQHDYYSVPGDVTHWLSLPAAPQQEVIGIDLANGKDASVEVVIENGKVISHG
ncbi:DUF551 domain-containing protein [Klebsiella aerogenes]|uniref:DUF551 domain-containing protein n=1 Tax=Klebsiella aerogenes TaxID=548 RepID=UPI0006944A6E|nr:DUF551 domain-containing protein [Klebsiella aerogenes]